MKKVILLLVTICLSVCMAHSQEQFEKLYIREKFRPGLFIKIVDNRKWDLQPRFFTGPDINSKKNQIKKRAYKSANEFRDRIFKINDVLPPATLEGRRHHVLILEDMETGQVLYFYAPTLSYYEVFLVYDDELARANRDAEKYFDSIKGFILQGLDFKRTVDRIDKVTIIYSPGWYVSIGKWIKPDKTTYYLIFRTSQLYERALQGGVKVLFDDGTLWTNFNATINVELSHDGTEWDYSTFIEMDKANMKIFCEKQIEEFKLGGYNQIVASSLSELFPEYVKAIQFEE